MAERLRITPPLGIERDFRVMMAKRLRQLHARLVETIRDVRLDGPEDSAASIGFRVRAVRERWLVEFPASALDGRLRDTSGRVDAFTTRKTARAVERVVPIDVSNVLANAGKQRPMWAADNVALITKLETTHADQVAAAVTKAVLEGGATRDVTKVLQKRMGISRRHAAFIARDQIGTLNSQVSAARMKDLGIRRFRWSDSGDDRVRELHQQINGQVYDYPSGHPTEGLPGSPPGCRCVAEPVLE